MGFPWQANITRRWSQGQTSYVVVIPRNVPPTKHDGSPPNLGTRVIDAFPGLVPPTGSPADSDTWQNWVDDVRGVFNKYNGPNTPVRVTFAIRSAVLPSSHVGLDPVILAGSSVAPGNIVLGIGRNDVVL